MANPKAIMIISMMFIQTTIGVPVYII